MHYDHKMQGEEGTESHLITNAILFKSFTTRNLIYYLIKLINRKINKS